MNPGLSGFEGVRAEVRDLAGEMVRLRRDFHRHPEPGFEEVGTAAKVAEWLEGCGGYQIRTGVAKTGVVADLIGRDPSGPLVALRADMDALRIQEQNEGIDYASENPGVMHACGHDAHTAILLGVARVLADNRDALKGGVRLIFQPAEEGPGGAEPMIREGVLRDPKPVAIFGLHVWSLLPVGDLALGEGPIMAYTDELQIRIRGKGGHGAMPQETIDPIVAASHLIVELQSVVSRSVDPLDSAVLSIGKIRGGSIMNAIADEVILEGTQRSFLPETQALLKRRLDDLGRGLDKTFGTQTEVTVIERYPATVNDPEMTRLASSVAEELLGPGHVQTGLRLMGGEDMSFYLREVPGCFFFIGAGNAAKGISSPHHNPGFNLDEDSFVLGAELLLRLVERFVL
ncbi:MAG: amidohydrolase [Candidatus Eisenbacteria sp.]|nr:amidohydrolase [Candidatus Eisenbacteria bacterium]